MPDKDTMRRAKEDKAEGKAASTQAGEFVREEIEHIREGKHGARSTKQAIAIGLSKARRAESNFRPPNAARPPRRPGTAPSKPMRPDKTGTTTRPVRNVRAPQPKP